MEVETPQGGVGPLRSQRAWQARPLYTSAAVAGVSIGALSLWMHEAWPPPWDVGGHSFATWTIVPFLLGRRAGTSQHAFGVGVLSLCLLVVAYYLTLVFVLGRGDFTSTISYWALAALTLGGPLGLLGRWSVVRTVWGWIASGVPGAVFLSEAWPASAHFLFYTSGSNVVWGLWVATALLLTLLLARGSWASTAVGVAALGPLTIASVVISQYALTAFVHWTSTL